MKRLIVLALALGLATTGCPDDDGTSDPDTGTQDAVSDVEEDTTEDIGTDTTDVSDVEPDTGPTGYKLTIENTSDETSYPTAFSPGALALHNEGTPMYTVGETDPLDGLPELAEEGEAAGLVNALTTLETVVRSQAFEGERGPILPGESVSIVLDDISADQTPRLSFATMFVESNDYVIGTSDSGYLLYDEGSVNTGNLTSELVYTDVGTERDQYPYHGPTQAPRQDFPQQGAGEGIIEPYNSDQSVNTTRALPQAYALVDVNVTESNGEFTFTINNIGQSEGGIVTPLSPPVYAVHNASVQLFQRDQQPTNFIEGLEGLAEDGLTDDLVSSLSSLGGVKSAAAAGSGVTPAGSVQFTVTPDSSHRRVSFASMVVRTNDAFVAMPPSGLTLLDDQGNARSTNDLEAELRRRLAIWDAGTELNESPGNGMNQPYFTEEPGVGVPDSDVDGIQVYRDHQNDLADASELIDIEVVRQGDTATYEFTVTNTTDGQATQYMFSPILNLAHSANNPVFQDRSPASMPVTQLAEAGNPQPIVDARNGAAATGEMLAPGETTTFTITPTDDRQQFTFMTMVIPSNDAFIAANPAGVSLLAGGEPRDPQRVQNGINNTMQVWDAGTEVNQPGGAGAGQSNPFIENSGQVASTGPDEGDGTVRRVDSPLMPAIDDIIEVTLEKR